MAAAYLHGVETIEFQKGAAVITVIKSAVIGLVGTAPKGATNTLTLISNGTDGITTFGEPLTGFTIPQALEAIFAQGPATVLVVNVGVGTAVQVTDEALTVDTTTGETKLAFNPIVDVVLLKTYDDTTPTPVAATLATSKYTIDAYGNIVITDSQTLIDLEAGDLTAVKATYKKFNSASVTTSDLIGSVDGTTNVRTGSFCYELAYPTFGFKAKIFIMPGYSSTSAIAARLAVLATKYRGIYYTDAPIGATPAVAMAGRGPLGTLPNFNTAEVRAELLYPHLKAYDTATDADQNRPFSQFQAGLRAAIDQNEGYWVSTSNHEIKGITGVERLITGDINDADTEMNQLNSVGITTIYNSFGTGVRSFGNRNASFPSTTGIMTFTSSRRVADVIEESIERAMLPYLDKPINQGIIDSIREAVNGFLRTQEQRGAIKAGQCTFDPVKNPSAELTNGHLILDYNFAPNVPLERLTFNGTVDSTLIAFA